MLQVFCGIGNVISIGSRHALRACYTEVVHSSSVIVQRNKKYCLAPTTFQTWGQKININLLIYYIFTSLTVRGSLWGLLNTTQRRWVSGSLLCGSAERNNILHPEIGFACLKPCLPPSFLASLLVFLILFSFGSLATSIGVTVEKYLSF